MKPNKLENKQQKLKLEKVKGKEISLNFEGGKITSNAGIVLIAELDKKLKITEQFSQCFQDHRHPSYIDYTLHNLLIQRIYSIILGYEDVNDHDLLRYDGALEIALRQISNSDLKTDILAGKSTINRLEYCPLEIIDQSKSRYHKIELLAEKMENMFVEIFLQLYKKEPKSIILDMDVTDDQVHGEQEEAYFNKYYGAVCYAPLYIFSGRNLLVAKLRPSNVDPAAGALEELTRVIRLIRQKWKKTKILVRGDSGYSREEIMNLCEEQPGVDFALAMATNEQLKLKASDIIAKAKKDYEARFEPVSKLITSFFGENEDTEIGKKIVPNARWFRLRLWFSSIAYVLVQAFRERCLVNTDFEVATVGTIRLHLMKLGAKIWESARRIKIEITSACVYQDILTKVVFKLQSIPNSG